MIVDERKHMAKKRKAQKGNHTFRVRLAQGERVVAAAVAGAVRAQRIWALR